jgi:hypothetical protein
MTDQNKPEDDLPPVGSSAARAEQTNEHASTSPHPAKAPSGPSAPASDELPYIDDPVSKWWVAVVVTVFALIFAWAILFGAGGLFDGILGSDEPTPTPEATVVATMEPTQAPSATPEATAGPAVSSPESTQGPETSATAPAEPGPTGTAPPSGAPAPSPEG